jgi:hypothetical protein
MMLLISCSVSLLPKSDIPTSSVVTQPKIILPDRPIVPQKLKELLKASSADLEKEFLKYQRDVKAWMDKVEEQVK